MKKPFILVNLKTYSESIGQSAHRIARAVEDVSNESGVQIGIAPMYMDIHPVSMHYSIPVYAQHADGVGAGTFTGHVTAESLKIAGAVGSLVNHSERRLTLAQIEGSIQALRLQSMSTVVCTNNEMTSRAAAALKPDYVAIEPPELIGSGISVSKANPEIIKNSVSAIREVNDSVKILTGAGIQSGECVRIALDLGTDGVLLASSVVKASDPAFVLRDLVSQL